CQYNDVWLYDASEEALCSQIASHYVQSRRCAAQSSYPNTTVTTSLVNKWIVEHWQPGLYSNAPSPSGCFMNLHTVITWPNNGGTSVIDTYIDGGGAGIAMHSKHFYVSDMFLPQCDSCVSNYVAEPINPAARAMFNT